MKETEEFWTVVWFPPTGDKKKKFSSEDAARKFAAREDYEKEDYPVAFWNPLLTHTVRVVEITETILTL